MNTTKLGLVLSGGGAKGAYHVGVIRYLAEQGMKIDAVAGASIGALNGSIIAGATDMAEASAHLTKLWNLLAEESPLKINNKSVAIYLGYLCLLAAHPASRIAMVIKNAFSSKKILDLGVLQDSPVRKLIQDYTSPGKLKNGIPLYVSIFESEDTLQTLGNVVLAASGMTETKPSKFRHVQSFADEKMLDVIFASASLPVLFAPQEINGKRYLDGGIGGWSNSQGNTPISPLIQDAGCTHVIVTHLTDGSLWNRHDFPATTILEVRPKNPIALEGMAKDLLGFKPDKIKYWIDNGYEDASRCIGNVKRVLELQAHSAMAKKEVNDVLAELDNDGFTI